MQHSTRSGWQFREFCVRLANQMSEPVAQHKGHDLGHDCNIRELTILGRERRPRLQKTKTAITEIKAVQLCRKHNLKDLLSE